jgi:hypothetical protein
VLPREVRDAITWHTRFPPRFHNEFQ